MSKLYLIRSHDAGTLELALTDKEAEVALLQEAVLFANNSISGNAEKLVGRRVYVLEHDAVKRGIMDRLVEGVEPIGYERFVDLLFSGLKVINL